MVDFVILIVCHIVDERARVAIFGVVLGIVQLGILLFPLVRACWANVRPRSEASRATAETGHVIYGRITIDAAPHRLLAGGHGAHVRARRRGAAPGIAARTASERASRAATTT